MSIRDDNFSLLSLKVESPIHFPSSGSLLVKGIVDLLSYSLLFLGYTVIKNSIQEKSWETPSWQPTPVKASILEASTGLSPVCRASAYQLIYPFFKYLFNVSSVSDVVLGVGDRKMNTTMISSLTELTF